MDFINKLAGISYVNDDILLVTMDVVFLCTKERKNNNKESTKKPRQKVEALNNEYSQ